MIVGITGTIGAGKGTVVEYLVKEKGFVHFSARALLIEEIERRGLPVNRDTTTLVANDLRAARGPGYLAEELCRRAEKIQADGKNAVVESLRSVGEIQFIKTRPHSSFFAVDAKLETRYKRVQARQTELDQVTFEQFSAQETREMHSDDPFKQNLSACIALADVCFKNDGTKAELHAQIDLALKKC